LQEQQNSSIEIKTPPTDSFSPLQTFLESREHDGIIFFLFAYVEGRADDVLFLLVFVRMASTGLWMMTCDMNSSGISKQ